MKLGNECRSCLLRSQTKKVNSYNDDYTISVKKFYFEPFQGGRFISSFSGKTKKIPGVFPGIFQKND